MATQADNQPNIVIIEHQDPHNVRDVPIIVGRDGHPEYEHSKIPIISTSCAVILLIVNIFLPGWGTVALMCFSHHHKIYFLLIGLLQFLLTCIIIGWVWAIITSVQVIKKSRE